MRSRQTKQPKNELHAHYCATCQGYSPCYGPLEPCLLTDDCVQCGAILEGTPAVQIH
jgi:hypothetical protein